MDAGCDVGRQLIAMLGIDPASVSQVDITLRPGCHTWVQVTMRPQLSDVAGEIVAKRFQLVERQNEEPE